MVALYRWNGVLYVVFVERVLLLIARMCPFAVAIEGGIYFRNCFAVNCGYEVKYPASIARFRVSNVGLNNEA